MNRFYDTPGDVSMQLSPWESRRRGLDPDKALFLLQQPVRFRSDIAQGDIVVPDGFLSDLASIPQFAWSIFMSPDDPRIDLGSWVHDFLYSSLGKFDPVKPPLTREQCDSVLSFEAMPECGANRFQQCAVYVALRLFGRGHWKARGSRSGERA